MHVKIKYVSFSDVKNKNSVEVNGSQFSQIMSIVFPFRSDTASVISHARQISRELPAFSLLDIEYGQRVFPTMIVSHFIRLILLLPELTETQTDKLSEIINSQKHGSTFFLNFRSPYIN